MTESTPSMPALKRSKTQESKDESLLCRICRGEATDQEPLFHPCKCSGSIMYVHQDCLMEWLSHSQKKHCELCKTPFRFTKLYAPNMPDSLPTSVFLRRAAAHVFHSLLYWMRGLLVTCTWAIWLPWTMRFVWWGLFWLADVGWVKDPNTYTKAHTSFTNGTASAGNVTAAEVNSALIGEVLKGPAILRMTSWMLRLLVSSPSRGALNELTPDNHMQSQTLTPNSTQLIERGTLLSGVGFLANLTPSPLANRVVIDVLEGQIISIALVALIILILLIREWVVQQQPQAVIADEDPALRNALRRRAEQEGQNGQRPRPRRRRTSILLKEPDDFVKTILEEHGSTSDGVIDLEKGQEAYMHSLHARTIAASNTFREGFDPQENADHEPTNDAEREALLLYGDIKEAEKALRIVYAKAVQDEDLSKLRALRVSLHLLRKTIVLLPLHLARPIKENTDQTKASMKNMITMTKVKTSLRSYGGVPPAAFTEDRVQSGPQPQQDHDQTSGPQDASETTPRIRPTMPPRDESFVATGIQRSLQEGIPSDEPSAARETDAALENEAPSDTDSYDNVEQMTQDIIDQYEKSPSEVEGAAEAASDLSHVINGQQSSAAASTPDEDDLSFVEREDSPTLDESARPQHPGETALAPVADVDPIETAAAEGQTETDHPAVADDDQPEHPPGLITRAVDWLWGDLEPAPAVEADGQAIVNAEDNAVAEVGALAEVREPDQPVNAEEPAQDDDVPHEPAAEAEPPAQAHEPDAEPAQPAPQGLFADLDGVDDVEELEGIMELVGMQGALANLFTNAMFASVFISCTIVIAVWIPFLLGKVALILLAHPISMIEAPFRFVTCVTNAIYDIFVCGTASVLLWLLLSPVNLWINSTPQRVPFTEYWQVTEASVRSVIEQSNDRLSDLFRSTIQSTDVAYSNLTFDSHAAVRALEALCKQAFTRFADAITKATEFSLQSRQDVQRIIGGITDLLTGAKSIALAVVSQVARLPAWVKSGNFTITFSTPAFVREAASTAPEWSALDRGLGTTLGYAFIALLGSLYLMRLAPLARNRNNKKIENVVIEILQQAGGITKVVLIISIEMLAFPLYCGLLLDIAMLPLFKDATIQKRLQWTRESPYSSLFVHWFIGTAYMFHFALFVAMCRRIFRRGVLYFIRDPDDPTFHPVRDVLERSVISQLRKIASSAMIYGGLVIVCIGSLVWTLGYGLKGILPIQWRSTGGANAFPLDLIVYIFVRPFAVRQFALADWLQEYYQWFFRKCAKALNLTEFLFGEVVEDERGPLEQRGGTMQPSNGKWMRVPTHDRVRVPRGVAAFVAVDEQCNRLDRGPEPTYPQGKSFRKEDYRKVYMPKYHELHLAAFVTCLWSMTATVGVGFTIVPLLLGRLALSLVFGRSAPVNDAYAFAVGTFVVCTTALTVVKMKKDAAKRMKKAFKEKKTELGADDSFLQRAKAAALASIQTSTDFAPRAARCVYVYGMLWVVCASAFAALLHLYVLAPISALVSPGSEPYTIRLSESLVLGIQMVRIMIVILRWNIESRSARAVNAIFERGYSNPSPALASRYLYLPLVAISCAAIVTPAALAQVLITISPSSQSDTDKIQARVYAYPATLGIGLGIWIAHLLILATSRWRLRIRDEVFLIGERLHNYGEAKPPTNAPHSTARVP